jgi:hypothetical protein
MVGKGSIIESICDAFKAANEEYEKWSGGNWVGECGIESLLTVHIARQIYANIGDDDPQPYVTLEEHYSIFLKRAIPKPGPLPSILKGNKRADVVVRKNSKRPYAVIEVKRKWTNNDCLLDIDRLRCIKDSCGINVGGRIEVACMAVSLQQNPKGKKLDEQYSKIRGIVDNHLKPKKWRPNEVDPYKTKDPNNKKYLAGGLIIEII